MLVRCDSSRKEVIDMGIGVSVVEREVIDVGRSVTVVKRSQM